MALHQCLDLYCTTSGQSINFLKSSTLFGSNTPSFLRDTICDYFQVPLMKASDRYLGLPSSRGRSRRALMTCLREKVFNKIDGWKSEFLSSEGKEVLVKSVAMAMPSYAMSAFHLPKSFCNKLTSAMHKFWWSNGAASRGVYWVRKEAMQRSKFMGGLGIRVVQLCYAGKASVQIF